jgi:predicted phage-related endonuclease
MTTDARQRFLERRLTGVGASDAPIIVGLGYISAAELWEQKTKRLEPQPETIEMRIGTLLEPVVSKFAEEKLAALVEGPVKLSARNRFRRRAGRPWQFTHLDRTLGGIPVELKVPQFQAHEWGPEDEGERGVALRYRPQIQHQIAVLDVPFAYVCAFMPSRSDPIRLYRVERNEAQIEALDEAERDFWQHVLDDEPVEVDGSESSDRYLRRRHPFDDGSTLIATPEQRLLTNRLFVAQASKKEAEREFDDLKGKLRQQMGDAAALIGPGFEISYRTYEQHKVAWEQVAGVYRRAIEQARERLGHIVNVGNGVTGREVIDGILSDGTGTTDLGEIVGLYSSVDKVRRFVPTRKEGSE